MQTLPTLHVPSFIFTPLFLLLTAAFLHSSASNRIIGAKDHASIQMNVAEVSWEPGRREGWDVCAGKGRPVPLWRSP